MEAGEIVLLCLAVLSTVAFPVWFFRSGRAMVQRSAVERENLLAAYRPTQTLAEASVAISAPVELRARAIRGALRVWLDCKVPRSGSSWSVSGTLSFRAVPEGAGYRADHASVDVPFSVGEDSEGTVSSVACPAGATGIRGPSGVNRMDGGSGGTLLQLVELTSSVPGSELFVRVVLDKLSGAEGATFRVFLGVSAV